MKYIIVLALLLTAACSFAVVDSPELRSAIETKMALTVLPVPPLPEGRIRISLFPTDTPEPSLMPTVTETPLGTATPCDPVVKGNIAADGTKIAHSPGQANYDNVVIDEAKGEKLFCTLEQAKAEGWRAAQR